jgi:tetratricopeptide (TPR) repeat protein
MRVINIKKKLLPAVICLALSSLITGSVSVVAEEERQRAKSIFMEMENPELMAMAKRKLDMTMYCAPIRDEQVKRDVYTDMSDAKWDRFGMGCALEYGTEIIDESSFSFLAIEDKLILLGNHLTYFEVLDKQYNAHYQGGNLTVELSWRWEKNRRQAEVLLDDISIYESLIPEIKVLKAAYYLASTRRETATKVMLESTITAMNLLNEIVEDDAEVIEGLPLLLLGQVLLALPEFSGGDPIRAIELLQQGISIAPENLSFHRWLIEGLVAEREDEVAIDILQKASQVSIDSVNPQDYVDMATVLGGIAIRLGEKDIASIFSLNRKKLLSDKPYLLSRKQHASVGHGGADPITGEIKNEI